MNDYFPYSQKFLSWWQKQDGNFRGGLWMLMAAFLFSIMVTIIKMLGTRLPVFETLFFRQAVMTALVVPTLIKNFPHALITKRPDLQALRVVGAVTAMSLTFSAFTHLSLSEATAIGFSRTMFITLLAILFLKETVGIRRWMAVLIGFFGVLIMLTPEKGWLEFSGFNIWSLAALGGAAFAGFVMVIIRKLNQSGEKPITILSYQAFFVGLIMAFPTYYYWVTPTLEEWLWLGVLGAVSILAQMCNIRAYRDGEATAVASLDYTRLIYAALLGFLIFSELPTFETIAGASVIIAASLYTLKREAGKSKVVAKTKKNQVL